MTAPPSPVNTSTGVLLNVASSALFALMSAYTTLLRPLDGAAIYGWRMLLTVPALTLLVLAMGRWHEIRQLAARVRRQRFFWAQRVLSATLLGAQLWLFMWAPVNGHGLDVSLGYFLLPIAMVALGRLVFKERISRMQLLAGGLALAGIVYQLAIVGTVSWPALLVCLGYPGYFWLRRATHTNTLGSLWLDMTLGLPVSVFFVLQGGYALPADAPPGLPWLILGLGIISASALGLQALSAPKLNVTLFGLLIYVEPVLLVVVAAGVLGESIAPAQWPTYLAIWMAVLVLVAEGGIALARHRPSSRLS
ncbi:MULTISPECIES: EamA family transporter RarD [unclassified Pigmentiphaga]|uniref:EamA family transporter RarD n=1 Tax=unclassified Pigmentiphaga TaxID=2626614 RepID=UPI0010462727|nr:EamA family transporter RarD [Pigmentiphaga sp. D-2]